MAAWDNELVKEEKIMIPVQVNGKLRDTFEADRDLGEDAVKEIVCRSRSCRNISRAKRYEK